MFFALAALCAVSVVVYVIDPQTVEDTGALRYGFIIAGFFYLLGKGVIEYPGQAALLVGGVGTFLFLIWRHRRKQLRALAAFDEQHKMNG